VRMGVERAQETVRVVAVVVVDLERLVVVVVELLRVVVVVGVVVRGIRIGDIEWSKYGSCGRGRHWKCCAYYLFFATLVYGSNPARRLAEGYRQTVISFCLRSSFSSTERRVVCKVCSWQNMISSKLTRKVEGS